VKVGFCGEAVGVGVVVGLTEEWGIFVGEIDADAEGWAGVDDEYGFELDVGEIRGVVCWGELDGAVVGDWKGEFVGVIVDVGLGWFTATKEFAKK
jgi:hypothetical protein